MKIFTKNLKYDMRTGTADADGDVSSVWGAAR